MPFDEIPENEVEGYPCKCGGSITKCGDKWSCDSCNFERFIASQKQRFVVDKNGFEIKKGQMVMVYQGGAIRKAKVIEPFPDSPTVNLSGHWVDIDLGNGVRGMMSYVLEVLR